MPPAPASIATPPSPRSTVSWNPAVPPPPVGGAPFGIGLVVGGDGDEFPSRVVEGLADGLADGLFEPVAPGLGVVLPALGVVPPGLGVMLPGLGVLVPAVPLEEETAGLAEVLLVGEDVGGNAAEGEDDVQADTAAQANMAAMPQPTARHVAELAPVPTFMEAPHRPRLLKTGLQKCQGPYSKALGLTVRNGLFTAKYQLTREDQRLGSRKGGLRYWGTCSGAA
jgi:hypothetical protein